MKLYFNEGNCVRLKIPDQELDEVPEIVKRFEFVSNGTRVSVQCMIVICDREREPEYSLAHKFLLCYAKLFYLSWLCIW